MTAPHFDEKFLSVLNLREPAIAASLRGSACKEASLSFPVRLAVEDKGLVLEYDQSRWAELSPVAKHWWVVHEYLHYYLGHWSGRACKLNKRKWHAACDMAVNSILSNTYDHLQGFEDPSTHGLEPLLSAEHYYKILDSDLPESSDHTGWSSEYRKQPIADTSIGDALAGTEAGDKLIAKHISGLSKWHAAYKQFCRTSLSNYRVSRLRYSRRLGFPSLKRIRFGDKKQALVIVDTSASMIPFLDDIAAELVWLDKEFSCTIYQCDTEVRALSVVCNKINFQGLGGTDMNPALELAKNSDSLIVFTDGEFSTELIDINLPTLWIVFGDSSFTPKCGQVIKVK